MDLLQNSYWNIGHTKECRECEEEIRKERVTVESADLSDLERAEMAEYESIYNTLKTAVNAARRTEQRRLEVWNNRHMGPRWHKIIHELWPKYQKAMERMEHMERELAEKCDPAKFIQPNLAALQEFGLLGPEEKLTPIGVMATEVNEGHTILMPLAYNDPNIRSLLKTKEDIIAFLAIFLGERGEYNGMEVGGAVRASLRILNDIAVTCKERERRVGAAGPYNYWDLNADYVEIIWRFVNGEEVGILLQDYELFGGNFTRLLSKMTNILREWTTLATISSDTEMLNILSDAEKLLAVGALGSESLYLRLA
jgi:hypothetical protein